MQKDINKIIKNKVKLDETLVWELEDKKVFQYSEGSRAEKYLNKVFLTENDLSSNSFELEDWIKDWSSEYHLSRKRSNLLRGFNIDKSKKVLEVGCGCGAITSFLGENFDQVVSIEGSIVRAKLARLRTKELHNVTIICAPFQEIKFEDQFDIIFCIGVFEYSNMFVESSDPFDYILQYFSDILTPDGEIVIAIENQFGLKYFSSGKEDHTDIMFDGLEGYPRFPNKEKTFGYNELKYLIKRYFNDIDFYFPFPDYKTPSCVLSERFFSKVNAGELIGNFKTNSYLNNQKPLFDERLVLLELEKNKMLPFFSNSFLVVAGKQRILSMKLKSLGLIYNNRAKDFQSETSFTEQKDGSVLVEKSLKNGSDVVVSKFVKLHKLQTKWLDGLTLHAQIRKRVKGKRKTIEDIFALCKIWVAKLISLSTQAGGIFWLDGKYLDCLWSNCIIRDDECEFIDLEWEWNERINLSVLVIRSIYEFLVDIEGMNDLMPALTTISRQSLIKKIAECIGVEINKNDFKAFCNFEARLAYVAYGGKNYKHCWYYIYLSLKHKTILALGLNLLSLYKKIYGRIITYTD